MWQHSGTVLALARANKVDQGVGATPARVRADAGLSAERMNN